MPLYEYHCEACGSTFEVSQKMTEAPLDTCSCGKKGTVKRLLSAGTGVIFKGSGFYSTDYKNGASKSESKPDTKPTHSCGSGGCSCH